MGYTVEIVRNIYDDTFGACLSVGPDADGLGGLVRIFTSGKVSEDYYGNLDVTLPYEQAKMLGEALIQAADEMKKAYGCPKPV